MTLGVTWLRATIYEVPDFKFRNTIKLCRGYHIGAVGDAQIIPLPDCGAKVTIRPLDHENLSDAQVLLLEGGPYPTSEAAISAGKAWRDSLLMAFTAQQLGADFGDDDDPIAEPHPLFAEDAKAKGEQALRSRHGLLVYRADLPATFWHFTADAHVNRPGAEVAARAGEIMTAGVALSLQQRLALSLVQHAFFDENPETQFVLLVTAIEAVIARGERNPDFLALLDRCVSATDAADFPDQVKDSVLKFLEDGRTESIGAAGRRLVKVLGSRRYGGDKAPVYFTSCYSVRSNIVHGNVERPSTDELIQLIPTLQSFVIDLFGATIWKLDTAPHPPL